MTSLTTYLPTGNIYEKSRLATMNALRGDVGASFRSIFKPGTLAPQERTSLLDFLGNHPIVEAMIDTVTNPFVLLGAFLSFRYPLSKLRPQDTFKLAEKYKGMSSGMSAWTQNLGAYPDIFARYPRIAKYGKQIIERLDNWKTGTSNNMKQALLSFEQKAGSAITKEEQILFFHMLEGHDKAAGGSLARFLYPAIKKTLGANLKGKSLLKPGFLNNLEPQRATALRKLAVDVEGHLRQVATDFEPMFAADKALRQELNYILGSRGFLTMGVARWRAPKLGGIIREFYAPQVRKGTANIFRNQARGLGSQGERIPATPLSSSVIRREAATLPDMDDIEYLLTKGKYIDEGVYGAMRDYRNFYSRQIQARVQNIFDTSRPENLAGQLERMLVKDYGAAGDVAATAGLQAVATLKASNAKEAMRQFMKGAGSLGEVPQYVTSFYEPLEKYITSMAPTYASSVPLQGAPRGLWNALQVEAKRVNMTPVHQTILFGDYGPYFTGRLSQKFAERIQVWNDRKLKYWELLNRPKVASLFNKLPQGDRSRKYMVGILEGESSIGRGGAPDSAIAALLYQGALAFNPSPPIKNLAQTIITTLPMVGPTAMVRGLKDMWPGLQKYFRSYGKFRKQGHSRTIANDMAMAKAFPEFEKHALSAHSIFEGMADVDKHKWVQGASRGAETFKTVGMGAFSASERFNRLLTWHAGLARGRAFGMEATKLIDYADDLVRATQFPSGVLGTPRKLMNVPATLRQFTQFPLRMTNFLIQSTRYGGEGRNLGVIGRSMLASGLAYEGAKHLAGVDISESLLFGALPAPSWKGAPFYPAPLVPPLVSVAGGVGQAVLSGEYGRLPRDLAVMVPGGLAASRLIRTYSPTRADYSQYRQTGKIPLYDDRGFLTTTYTPMQLFMKSIGVRTTDQVAEQELTRYLLSQKEQLRSYRRDYLNALGANNLEKAEAIQRDYEKRYPGFGPLRIKKSDIRAVERRLTRTRLQRVVEGLPKETQPLFQEMVDMVEVEELSQGLRQGGDYLDTLFGP